MSWLDITFFTGVALLGVSVYYGCQSYPPGMGYDEEKRNNRISFAILITAVLTIIASFLLPR